LQPRYTQEFAAFALITSKALVNSRWNKVVNIASTKMMKKVFAVRECSSRVVKAEFRSHTVRELLENDGTISSSLRANGSRECAPDDRLREAIQTSAKIGRMDCFVACAPLRKRFAFVAGNDGQFALRAA
jgi:hypothetical protein